MRYKSFLVILIGWIFVVCIYDYAKASEFGPFRGKILDTDTKKPIEGVVVFIEWRQLHAFAGSTFYDAQETLTDKNGDFYIPGIWVFNPLVWLRAEAHVIIYKSGFHGVHVPWEAVLKPWGEQIAGTRRTYVLEVKDGKPVIMLKKLTIEERKRFSTPGTGDIPHQKKKLLIQEINKERKFFGLEEVTD